MVTTATNSAASASVRQRVAPPIVSVHHPAVRVLDSEKTRQFYEDILGVPLEAAVLLDDDGVGNKIDYMHSFHRMIGGDFLAFFDLPSLVNPTIFDDLNRYELRLGLKVDGDAELEEVIRRLDDAGVPHTAVVDNGLTKSIYLQDCNGIHVAVTTNAPDVEERLAQEKARAKDVLADWVKQHGSTAAN